MGLGLRALGFRRQDDAPEQHQQEQLANTVLIWDNCAGFDVQALT